MEIDMNLWNISMGSFRPSIASNQKWGDVIVTELTTEKLIQYIIADHRTRSPLPRTPEDYRVDNFSDEVRIWVRSKGDRFRTLVNLQYEGEA
jgi:hypothetical protein